MGFVYKYEAIHTLCDDVKAANSSVNSGLSAVKEASTSLVNGGDWQGNKATSVKDYLESYHGAIIASLGLIMKDIYDQAMLYQAGYESIDGSPHAVIPESELSELSTRITQMAPVFDQLSYEAESIVRSIAHIGTVTYSGDNGLPEGISSLAEKLDKLCADISQHEGTSQSEFEAKRSAISTLKANIANARGANLESFSKSALARDKDYQALATVFQVLQAKIESDAAAVSQAEITFQHACDVLDYEERVKKAERVKFWTGVATAVVSTIVIVGTGGAGLALVAGVGAVSGAINAGVGSYFDQTVGTVGCPGTVDGWSVFGATVFGGAVGAATSAVSFGIDSAASSIKSEGIRKVAEKAFLGGAKKVITGGITRAGDACYDSIVSGDSISTVLQKTFDAAGNEETILSDFAGGFTGSVASQGVSALSGKLIGDKLSPTETVDRHKLASQVILKPQTTGEKVYDIFESTLKETVKGMGTRLGSTLVKEGGDIGAAIESALDKHEVASDFISSGLTAVAQEAGEDINRAHQMKKIEKIKEKIDQDSKEFNKGNIDACKERGLDRDENGKPIIEGIAEAEIEKTYIKADDIKADNPDCVDPQRAAKQRERYWDGKAASEAAGLDPQRYKTHGTTVTDTVTGKQYTWDHGEFDPATGKTKMVLVPRDQHEGIRHVGSEGQVRDAYEKYGLGEVAEKYNSEDSETKKKAVTTGTKSSQKITTDPLTGQQSPADSEPEQETHKEAVYSGFEFLRWEG